MKREGRMMAMIAVVAVLCGLSAQADVTLPHVFGSHMVLQCDRAIPVWGWAEPGEKIEVKLGDAAPISATTGADGAWRVDLSPQKAGGPVTLTVTGKNAVTLEDVLIGEVWVCSGQSNMQWTVASSMDFEREKAAANFPLVRHIEVPRVPAGYPAKDFNGTWQVCSPDTVGGFTAAGYFMARHLHRELEVPIGLVNSSWGGTAIEPWTPPEGFAQVPALKEISDRVTLTQPASAEYKQALRAYLDQLEPWLAKANAALADEQPLEPAPAYPEALKPLGTHTVPTGLYNGMIAPLVPFAIRGAIWYQGESNHGEGMLYTEKMKALIGGWRGLWKQGDFPFYFVQIAPYLYGNEDPGILPAFWEAQAAAERIPNAGMVVTNDITDLNDIHPKNKQDVGKRLALLALARTYGKTDVVCSGPTFRALALEGSRLRVTFDNVGGGLVARDGQPLNWFEIIGPETDFMKANATIEGDSVALSAPEVAAPCAVRFAWSKDATPNLMNREGLPCGAFRAGEVPVIDYLALKVAEAKDYKLVYDLDLSKLAREITYDVDHSGSLGAFDRVAYFLDLKKTGEPARWVYVSIDAFTEDVKQIGIPTLASEARFQMPVAHMNVLSNVTGIVTGTDLAGGNLEFWPNNYGPPNASGVPNASASLWDFGDQMDAGTVDGYGCMQVGNSEAKQTIFAINNWKSGANGDLGIGNSEGETRDWTFTRNAGSYELKRLRVLVHPKG
ncbi:MAG: sialate O-acetylesterase [Armatimonadetes bacterium]|nr:sialate O-acetylesterase [Armatimonadota bacterium]